MELTIESTFEMMPNPFYEKWGPGRPTKEMVERRKLSIEWENSHQGDKAFEEVQAVYSVDGLEVSRVEKGDRPIEIIYNPRTD